MFNTPGLSCSTFNEAYNQENRHFRKEGVVDMYKYFSEVDICAIATGLKPQTNFSKVVGGQIPMSFDSNVVVIVVQRTCKKKHFLVISFIGPTLLLGRNLRKDNLWLNSWLNERYFIPKQILLLTLAFGHCHSLPA